MVWPVFNVSLYCKQVESRIKMMNFMKVLYDTVKMGTILNMIKIVNKCWDENITVEQVLSDKEWLLAGIDFLPC
ncbi:hypothetical protein CANARDRAFT_30258 [[Candida] arabinofermentans NRRL YB-2248]|uniref:Uncharacterized protein n=1 Tax=[Candida] arabinofermentans NRRL YB-2248 TaxID=983967 RepID=A0A1E4SUK5_9ASCO|nr:hypothetical protein CANARDRAFT_30258 [[Candida] arabinofermentans NRRL YB-2248]